MYLCRDIPHIYVHIPFCRSRCIYCDFFSTTSEALIPPYVDALRHEMRRRRREAIDVGGATTAAALARVHTIYIGGGTPSLLSGGQLAAIGEALRSCYVVDDGAEVTLEMNPEDVAPMLGDADVRRAAQALGINRVSMGVQTFSDKLLGLLRRRHSAATAVAAVRRLQAVGLANISIDLIYGLPGQTMDTWRSDLDQAFALGVSHVSAYALSFEEGTPLSRMRQEGRVREAPDELSCEMYEALCRRARDEGFEHYEISNFARPGFRSRHNSSYWTGEPYLGFGPGAHSFDGRATRRANLPRLGAYLDALAGTTEDADAALEVPPQLFTAETLTAAELYDEAVMCGLRTREGIDLDAIGSRFGNRRLAYLLGAAEPHLRAGRLHRADGRLSLTQQALMTSDDVMSDLMAE